MGVFSSRPGSRCDLARLRALAAAVHFDAPAGFPASASLPAMLFGPHTRPGSGSRLAAAPRHDGRRYRHRDTAPRGAAGMETGTAC